MIFVWADTYGYCHSCFLTLSSNKQLTAFFKLKSLMRQIFLLLTYSIWPGIEINSSCSLCPTRFHVYNYTTGKENYSELDMLLCGTILYFVIDLQFFFKMHEDTEILFYDYINWHIMMWFLLIRGRHINKLRFWIFAFVWKRDMKCISSCVFNILAGFLCKEIARSRNREC